MAEARNIENIVEAVRLFLRDYPELNRLVAGVEHSPGLIKIAVLDAIDRYNTTPPLIGDVTVESFPSTWLLIRLAAANLLQSVIALQARNTLTGSEVQTQVENPDLYMRYAQMLESGAVQQMLRLKGALNVQAGAPSGVNSEYNDLFSSR